MLRSFKAPFAFATLIALNTLQAQATIIDHNAVNTVSGYSQATMDRISDLSTFFSHASVGSNMIDGLNALHTSNSGFFKLQSLGASDTPPSSIADGRVYEYGRGNPGWSAKLTMFQSSLSKGWAGKVDLALDKFCYIDEQADASSYLSFMQGLEPAMKGTKLVYATMPLMTGSGSDNILRNNFNQAIRSFVSKHDDRLLFDIADIEAWDENGVQHTFTSGNTVYQQLAGSYSSDGGHLNTLGSQRLALGFYAIANASLAPVPEPSPWYMLSVGLFPVVAIARRRRLL